MRGEGRIWTYIKVSLRFTKGEQTAIFSLTLLFKNNIKWKTGFWSVF